MTITAKLYDGYNGNDLINMEIFSGSLGIIEYLIRHLEPEQEGLYIKAGDTQINISCGFVGYFVAYAVNISTEDIDTSFDLDSSNEVWDFVRDYLDNIIETARAWA